MTPIRMGDGTGLSPKGMAEVRKADGTVLWSADTIPDSGLVHHYDASELDVSDGGSVTAWPDLAGDADLSGSGTYRESSPLNSQPAVELDGTDDNFSVTGVDSSPPYHLFYVVEETAGDDNPRIITNEELGMQHRMGDPNRNGNDQFFHGEFVDLGNDYTNEASLFGTLHTASETVVRRNGSQIASASDTHSSTRDGTEFYWGSNPGGTAALQGYIAELLWYDEEKTGDELADIEEYLANKYGFAT